MKLLYPSALLALTLAMSAETWAEFDANLTLADDYMWRGKTRTDNNPALQGSINYAHTTGLYVGGWMSNIREPAPNDKLESYELDAYFGYARYFGDFAFDLAYTRFEFPDAEALHDSEELSLGIGYGYSSLFIAHNQDESYLYYNYGLAVPLSEFFFFDFEIGRQDLDSNEVGESYNHLMLGLTSLYRGLKLQVQYSITSSDEKEGDAALTFGVTKDF